AKPTRPEVGIASDASRHLREVDVERDAHLHRVLAGRHELVGSRRGLEGVLVRKLPFGVVGVARFSHRSTEDAPVPERPAGHLPAELGVLLEPGGVGLLLVENEDSNHAAPFSATRVSVRRSLATPTMEPAPALPVWAF